MHASSPRSRRVSFDDRSVVSSVRGVPAWSAILLAAAFTFTGVAIDAEGGELGIAFDALFTAGCIFASLLVARRGIFSTAVLPPLLLTIVVPATYLLAGTDSDDSATSSIDYISSILPLIERFPLLLAVTAVCLAISFFRAFVLQRRPRSDIIRRAAAASAAGKRGSQRPGTAHSSGGQHALRQGRERAPVDREPRESPRRPRQDVSRTVSQRRYEARTHETRTPRTPHGHNDRHH